jgi:anti-sigma factor RsiW
MSSELDCEQILLVQADWDGELSAAESAAIQSHRRDCEACAGAYETLQLTRSAMRKVPPYSPPEALHRNLSAPYRERRPSRSWVSGLAIGLAASVAAFLVFKPNAPQTADMLVDSRVRAAQSSTHLLDVISTNQHVVKPWFDGRLPYSPPVKDLADQGFPLLGARIDVIKGQSVAVLVYQAGRHQVDLFAWPTDDRVGSISTGRKRGFNLVQWTSQDSVLTAVSDLQRQELEKFAERWRAAP